MLGIWDFPASGLLGLVVLALCASARADVMESARMLPDDMMVMVSVESVSGLRAALEKTSLYGLYKDPAMQPFVTETERKARELIDTTVKEFWGKMKIENPPEQIPYPQGRVVLGISLFQKPTADASGGPNAPRRPRNDIGFRFAVLADMGSQVEQVKQMIRSLSASAANAGTTVARKEIGGTELNIIVPKEGSDDPTLYYGLKDNWLLVTGDTSSGADFTDSVVRRVGRSMPESLANKTGLKAAARTLGEAQIFTFVNPDALKSLLASKLPDKALAERIIQALGFGNVTGIASAVQIAGSRSQEMTSKGLIAIEGSKTGIPALLSEGAGPLKVNSRFMTRDIVGFVCANYDLPAIYDGIGKILQNVAFMDITMMVQAALGATAGEGGQPPVHLRDDVLAQTAAPLFFTWQMDKPYTFSQPTQFLVGLSVRDAARLDAALGRIHQAFLGAQPNLKRELLSHNLYLLPNGRSAEESEDGSVQAQAASTNPGTMAFSVAGDHLVFGQVDEVEQAIRSLQKEPENTLLSDPMFRYAREVLPSQASLYFYQNDRLNTEITWTALKQLARDLSKQAGDGSQQENASWNPLMMVMQKIKDYVDLNKLPEFQAVEKYWGASAGFMQSRPEGLYWESTALKPPPQ